jgi:hypothetical protein
MSEQGWGPPSRVLRESALWHERWALLQECRAMFARDEVPDDDWDML